MKTAIQQRALELGFDDCRFTTALPPDHAGAFEYWLQTGQHGEMSWLARNAEKRLDPRTVLPGAETIITLATSHHTAPETGVRPSRAQQRSTVQPALETDFLIAIAIVRAPAELGVVSGCTPARHG